jgi:hypothetical protein
MDDYQGRGHDLWAQWLVTCLEAQVKETWNTERKQSYREWGSNASPLRSGSGRGGGETTAKTAYEGT